MAPFRSSFVTKVIQFDVNALMLLLIAASIMNIVGSKKKKNSK